MITNVEFIILILGLFIATLYDIKYMAIPLWISLAMTISYTVFHIASDAPFYAVNLILAIVVFIISLLLAKFASLGGADCLFSATITLFLGHSGVFAVFLGYLVALIYLILRRREGEYPLIPFLTIGCVLAIINMRLL